MKSHFRLWMFCVAIMHICISISFAQSGNTSTQDLKAQYERGKKLYQEGKYAQAVEVFRPLSRIDQGNPYVQYASFFFGLSALQQGDYALAKNMFLQIKSKYPDWEKMDQVDYWLVNTYFRQGDYSQAIQLINERNKKGQDDKQTQEDMLMMKQYFLTKTESDSLLQALLVKFPKDKMIAEQLVNNISRSFYDTNKQLLLDSLVKALNINLSQIGTVSKEASIKKSVYNIAAMLPFLYDKLSPEMRQQGNQFILDLYQGIKMAVEDLNAEGINIQLYAYDTQRSYEKTQQLLQQDEMKNMDVIIGPLYPGPYRAVSEFSLKNQIYMFNPLSSNPQVIGENPFSYLIRPSVITEAKAAAQFALDSLDAKKALVITGTASQDSMRVQSFIENFQKDTTNKIEIIRKSNFNRDSMDELVDTLKYLSENYEESVIYVASDNQLVISNVVSAVVMANIEVPMIGNEEWMSISSISYDQLEDLNVYLLDPGYINFENEKLKSFEQRYRRSKYNVPNKYVLAGYDMMYFIGQMLNRYGIYFQEFFSEELNVNGLFYSGYNYFKANDNQRIPIIKFEDTGLIVVRE